MDLAWLTRFQPQLLALLRIITALLFLEHGLMKLIQFPAPQGAGPLPPLLFAAAIIEVLAGTLVALGLFTRVAAFVASGEMAVAYFMAHFPKSFWPGVNMGDAAILFCFVFLYLASAGAGAWSMEHGPSTKPRSRKTLIARAGPR